MPNSFTSGEGACGMKALSFVTGRMCRVQKSGPSLTGNLLFLPKALAVLYVIQPSNLLNLSWFRVLTELVNKMRDMQMDKTELGCLRAIVLFNPGARARPILGPYSLSQPETGANGQKLFCRCKRTFQIQRGGAAQREGLCVTGGLLQTEIPRAAGKVKAPHSSCLDRHRPELIAPVLPSVSAPPRFAKLLLRLPALRSIGLKCLEHLFFFKLIGDTPIDTFLMEMLEAPHHLS